MKVAEFVIPGAPRGKERPRVERNRYTGKVIARTPDKTVAYEELVRYQYKKLFPVFDGAVKMEILALYEIPKSTSKKNATLMAKGIIKPTKKPDCDNIVKIICDALNYIAYKDDSQVTDVCVTKRYITEGEQPCVKVRITEV